MARTVITINNPVLKIADDEAGLALGTAYQCQVQNAKIVATANYQTVPATGCDGPSQSAGKTSFALQIQWLQDWTDAAGLSKYAYDNDASVKWVEFQLDAAIPEVVATGPVTITCGSYGGNFGDGTHADSDQMTWPYQQKPDITAPAAALAADEAA
jgi:hypothetical protein